MPSWPVAVLFSCLQCADGPAKLQGETADSIVPSAFASASLMAERLGPFGQLVRSSGQGPGGQEADHEVQVRTFAPKI